MLIFRKKRNAYLNIFFNVLPTQSHFIELEILRNSNIRKLKFINHQIL